MVNSLLLAELDSLVYYSFSLKSKRKKERVRKGRKKKGERNIHTITLYPQLYCSFPLSIVLHKNLVHN